MLVTAVAGTTFTVTRGVEGTTPAAHVDTTAITHILTAAAIDQFRADNIQAGADASLPSAEKAGRLYLDTTGLLINRDTGAAWQAFGPIWPITRPVDGDYSWVNQGGATVATTSGGILLTAPASASDSVRARVKSAPAAPYTITAMLTPLFGNSNFTGSGLCFRESGSGKMVLFFFVFDDISGAARYGLNLHVTKFTDATTFSAHYLSNNPAIGYGGIPKFLRIADNNTNRICSVSNDGFAWIDIHTVGRTDFLTADQVGFASNNVNSIASYCHLHSWLEG